MYLLAAVKRTHVVDVGSRLVSIGSEKSTTNNVWRSAKWGAFVSVGIPAPDSGMSHWL